MSFNRQAISSATLLNLELQHIKRSSAGTQRHLRTFAREKVIVVLLLNKSTVANFSKACPIKLFVDP